MISSVRGTVLTAAGSTIGVEVAGVGLSVTVTPQHALSLRVGAETTVRTALIVREDDLALYGFREQDELTLFDLLRGVTGVGPKSAMGVLAAMAPEQIAVAIAHEDDAAFRKVSGIGPKTAKLIVLSLTGKVLVNASPSSLRSALPPAISRSVLAALVGLGWTERVAGQAVEDAHANASASDRDSVSVLLRLALAQLGPQQSSGAGS